MITAVQSQFSHLSHLQCSTCNKSYPADGVASFATCDKCDKTHLWSVYDRLAGITPSDIDRDERSMWRYFPLLPVFDRKNIVSLGEGFTPILSLSKLGFQLGLENLIIKDESFNPTGSFKARGMSAAVSKAKELGIEKCIVPTAGNAGGALSAYCAKAGIEAVVVMPEHTPEIFKKECRMYGAHVILEKGLISACARRVRELNKDNEYFDISTLKEPYRLEGKKTMGYEIAEQLNWKLPDVIIYPTGGGTGLIGMWKAFQEMIEMGWIGSALPKMIAVQSANCQPLIETWTGQQQNSKSYEGQATLANGLAVPNPFAEHMILNILRASGGKPMSVTEKDITDSMKEIARREGMLVAPEGAALLAALKNLLAENYISHDDNILLLNTGSGYKYLENIVD
jgi:threonine synthase